jgi:HSP20 family molecular chaperone IbpA
LQPGTGKRGLLGIFADLKVIKIIVQIFLFFEFDNFYEVVKMTLFEEIQRMIDESMARPYFERGIIGTHSDICEVGSDVVLTIELPGVDKKDIDIQATEDEIRVSVESKKKEEIKKENLYKAGSRYFNFSSNYSSPAPIDPKSVCASYANGVLRIRAKKKKSVDRGVSVKVN